MADRATRQAPEMVPPRDLFTAGDSPGRLVVDYAGRAR